jgi:hypothetical protein
LRQRVTEVGPQAEQNIRVGIRGRQ